MKFFLFLIIFVIFLKINLINSTFLVQELYYSNNSNTFYSYPSVSSSGICQFDIPFLIQSTSEPISNIITSSGLIKWNTNSNSTDAKEVLGTLSYTGQSGAFYFDLFSNDIIQYKANVTFQCQNSFNLTNLKYSILNSGIWYNSLAVTLKFSEELSVTPNLTLDISLPNVAYMPYIQNYHGQNIYSILFNYNVNTLYPLSNGSSKFSILFQNNTVYDIIIPNSPYKSSEQNPITNLGVYYQTDSMYLEISNITNLNTNFFTTYLNSSPFYIYEPYLVSSQDNKNFKYLQPLYGDSLATTKYSMFYYYLNTYKSIFTQQIVQSPNSQDFFSKSYLVFIDWIESGINIPNYQIPMEINIGGSNENIFSYPFGFIGGNAISANNTIVLPTRLLRATLYYVKVAYGNFNTFALVSQNTQATPNSSTNPSILKYDIQLIPYGKMIISMTISNSEYLDSVSLSVGWLERDEKYKSFSPVDISADFKNNGDKEYQINIDRMNLTKITLDSTQGISIEYYLGSSYIYNLNNKYTSLKTVDDMDRLPTTFDYLSCLKGVNFFVNDLKATNTRISNKMYISLDSSFPRDRELKVQLIFSDYRLNERKDTYYTYYNSTSGQFEFEFNIPMNIKPGNVAYMISLDSFSKLNYYSYQLPNQYQLRIAESNNIDLLGPIVTKVTANLDSINNIPINRYIYTIEIQDSANGFNSGYVIIRGDLDITERNISITPSNLYGGTIYKGVYSFNFQYDAICISQTFSIVYAYFLDNEGYWTEYRYGQINNKNPFYLIQDSFNPKIASVCNQVQNNSSLIPTLTSLSIPKNILFYPNELSRTLNINYTVSHPSGISTFSPFPKVYLSGENLRYYQSFETTLLDSNSTHAVFSSKIIAPYSGSPSFKFMIYGVVSKSAIVGGFNPNYLKGKGFDYSFTGTLITRLPYVQSTSKLSSSGAGGLWLYGSYLNNATKYFIQYTQDSNDSFVSIIPTNANHSTIYFSNIKPTNRPINIYYMYGESIKSDIITVTPIIYNLISKDSSPSSLCKGTPLCGGSSQGQCLSTGCKCISPWVGDDCMSRVIEVPPPTINQTDPDTNIVVNQTQDTIKGIISIVGVRELEIDSKIENEYYFTDWTYKLISNDSYVQRYQYQSTIKKLNQDVSNITVSLDWYKVESTIQFAEQTINLNPYTIKYTISITNGYPFSNKLNTLQLIMKASIESSNSNACSKNQFGQSINDDSDYVKLQIDKLSFYGRFIKRCIIDNNKVITLSNTMLDSQMNTINNKLTHQSYIGINIAQFTDSVIIDPDFSVLLNSDTLKCDDNTGLSTSQIVGIAVGASVLFIALLIIIGAIMYRYVVWFRVIIYSIFFKKSKKLSSELKQF